MSWAYAYAQLMNLLPVCKEIELKAVRKQVLEQSE